MKAVLISIQPYWAFLIIAKTMGWNIGKEKTVEVRKNYPKDEKWDNVAKIYCSKDKRSFSKIPQEYQPFMERFLGKVIGEFVCDCIAHYESELCGDDTFERIQEVLEPDDFAEYGEYEYHTIADNGDDFWKDNMLCKASCVSIEELRKYIGTGFHEFYGWNISELKIYEKPKELFEFKPWHRKCFYSDLGFAIPDCRKCYDCRVERPPQSWCYVEVTDNANL